MDLAGKGQSQDLEANARYRTICSEALLLPPGKQAEYLLGLDRANIAEQPSTMFTNDRSTATAPGERRVALSIEETQKHYSPVTASNSTAGCQQTHYGFSTSPKRAADDQYSNPPAKRPQLMAVTQSKTRTAPNSQKPPDQEPRGADASDVAETSKEPYSLAEQYRRSRAVYQENPMSIDAVIEQNKSAPR
ncbi:uncharacterized protein K460DRAFT_101275 [Cucurbitaria berberidis CBS 394.84]|uniref:Uncharacterized protein n=1 Tax=Cucurbitaria berberidis CBS 394.84 TaxID=1168544 RepID=A0A9P4GGT2_9PLEO|nr:uncharacterized protein K460DRAFT_101275 [Cucurbitaria berberidis CBS 394.84]KAF1844976.1 hypothetical protein K460DRAFT_101275 [Cucurbitaria berberidis CBS 394.84]